MIRRRWLVGLGVIIIATLLAFPLHGVVHQLIVVPLAYLLWLLDLVYLSLNQSVWWAGIVLIVLFMLIQSMLPVNQAVKTSVMYNRSKRGNVEALAASIQKSNKGIYFKWLVANRLGKLAFQILSLQEHGKPRSVFAPLTAEGWDSTTDVQQYLEKGLHGSFAEFPNARWFAQPKKTPLDQDVNEVVEFLEEKVNNG